MPVTFGAIAPWLDNWIIQRQLWNPGNKTPGNELELIPTNRNLTVQWRDSAGDLVYASSELQSGSAIAILDQSRGVVGITLSGTGWNNFRESERYTCEVIAYGFLYDSFEFSLGLPEPGLVSLSGQQVYGAPREILELIGRIPGAVVEMLVNLSGGWSRDSRGYFTKSIPKSTTLYGLFVNDQSAKPVAYADLAIAPLRAYARVTGDSVDTVYVKCPEDLTDPFTYVETAHNRYVLRCLEEASTEIDRKTGRKFGRYQVYRELRRGLYKVNQVSTRYNPVTVDSTFRVDCYSYSRTLVRRYNEASSFTPGSFPPATANRIFVDSETGILTLTESFWDWVDWGNDVIGMRGLRGLSFFTPGETAIEITYVAGTDNISTDISEAAANLAAIRQGIFWQQAITQGMQSMSIGCVNMNFGQMFNQWIPSWQSGADSIIGAYQKIEIEAF